jgi:predicted acylesterase/phospholipase RssA
MQIGLALGSGSARGWAHIGVIDALAGHGIRPEIICGTSIGALVGASYVAGNLGRLETARFFEVNAALNGNRVGKHSRKRVKPAAAATEPGIADWIGSLIAGYATPVVAGTKAEAKPPGLFEAIAGSVNIMQDRITRSRMAGDPPDIVRVPRLAQLGLLEFFRAEEAIAEGRRSVERMLPEIQAVLEQAAR